MADRAGGPAGRPQASPAAQRAAAWQGVLDRAQADGRLPSLAAGVLLDGELVWTGGAGAPTGPDRQYRIGSITKTMTAVLVLQCVEDGLLGIDDRLGLLVPESGYADASVRDLLAHASGMQSEPAGPWWERVPGTDIASLLAGNDGSGAVAGAGEYFHYSNLGYALLGEAVARARGATWAELVQERLLRPLGMSRTSWHPEPPHAQGHSVGHFTGVLTDEPHADTRAMAPAGQLWSTITDLARWAAFLARGHAEVLPPARLREAARAVPPATDYGLGLRLLAYDGRWLVGHTGSMPGFLASLFVDPETGDGVVALTDATTGFDTAGFPLHVLAAHLPGGEVEPWRPTSAVPPLVAELVGLWFWGNTAFEMRWSNERLELRNLAMHALSDVLELCGERVVGVSGYHRGETMHVVRRPDGSVSHLECATFVYTRTPYDPSAPIPGGVPG
ncbi:MAG TPA: serine hydrolase domain-containing protein [Marmoricola sp.]|nr:serine hydrolase domain-containing protein [Marmoricola sp.]